MISTLYSCHLVHSFCIVPEVGIENILNKHPLSDPDDYIIYHLILSIFYSVWLLYPMIAKCYLLLVSFYKFETSANLVLHLSIN